MSMERSFDSIGESTIETSLGVVVRQDELRPCIHCKTLTHYVWDKLYNGVPAYRVPVCSDACMTSHFPTQYLIMVGNKKEKRNYHHERN